LRSTARIWTRAGFFEKHRNQSSSGTVADPACRLNYPKCGSKAAYVLVSLTTSRIHDVFDAAVYDVGALKPMKSNEVVLLAGRCCGG
jgi:hypothetical protein